MPDPVRRAEERRCEKRLILQWRLGMTAPDPLSAAPPRAGETERGFMDCAFSSATDEWATPIDTFVVLSERHGPFDLDVCATSANAKCARFFAREDDGLSQEWAGRCWMNPPYGRTIGKWMSKAYAEAQRGCKVVCLVPARTDTAWWHDFAMKGEITFLRGRLKFGGHQNSAPFPSAVVVFEPPTRPAPDPTEEHDG